jgi:hypothetical protein
MLAAFVGASGPGTASSSPPSASGLAEDLQGVVEEEVWRAGGPREDRMLDFFRQAVESGKSEAASAVGKVLQPLFARRWLDPTPFAEYEKARSGELNVVWQQELALWKMTAAERQREYAEVLRTGRSNHELGLTWNGAANRALLEQVDNLVPEIEATMERDPHANYQKAETRVPRADLLELAHARSGDWEANYLKLIREKLEAQARAFDGDPNSPDNRLIREALLELVHTGNRRLLAPLKTLWRSINDPEMEKPENQRIYAGLVKQSLRDPEWSRPGPAAACLVRAIQALGDPSFQEKNTQHRKHLEDTKRRLAEAGWLKPTAEVQ